MGDTDYVLDALRLRVTAAAQLMLAQLAGGKGPLDLVHRCMDAGRGAVAWVARGNVRGGGFVAWADGSGSTLFVRASDVPALRDVQLVLDVEFDAGHSRYDSAEVRLVTLFRGYTEAEQEMLDYVIGRRAQQAMAGLLSSSGGAGRHP
jgi:hypothetical protein